MTVNKPQGTEFSPSTNRIEAFSDGVFAIVATLLVLELRVPELADNFTEAETFNALYKLGPKFAGFVFTFLALAIYWVNHHQLFHSIKSADRPLLWYNNALLFWLCFVPFPTAFIGEYPSRIVPVMLYGSVMTAAGISFNLLARHAVKAKLFRESISQTTLKKSMRRGMLGPIVYSISVITAPLSTCISLVIFAVVPLLYFIPQKIVEEKQPDFLS
jgi:uncharacterized membrane protein